MGCYTFKFLTRQQKPKIGANWCKKLRAFPYSNGGHRETCFNSAVYAHYIFECQFAFERLARLVLERSVDKQGVRTIARTTTARATIAHT